MWRLAPQQLSETKHSTVGGTVLQVTSAESGSPISVVPRCRYRLGGVCSELVQTLWPRLSRGWVAGVSSGYFTGARAGYRLIETCQLAPYIRTRQRREREGLLADTSRINVL